MASEISQSKGMEARALSRLDSAPVATLEEAFSVHALEHALLAEFPACDAESWDRTGLLVGDPAQVVKKAAVALDPTVAAIRKAANLGANVLVTHHPAFLDAPDAFRPAASVAQCNGAVVWAAIQHGVALMNFHTALDVNPRAAQVLPSMLGLTFTGKLVQPIGTVQDGTAPAKGYGQICTVPDTQAGPDTLARLAARCLSVFGRAPRVWGDSSTPLRVVVTATGLAGAMVHACLAAGADCLVCGEIKYHTALDLSQAGLCIIELGHDVSELPLAAVLADALVRVGMSKERIAVIDQSDNWAYPEAWRL